MPYPKTFKSLGDTCTIRVPQSYREEVLQILGEFERLSVTLGEERTRKISENLIDSLSNIGE